LKLLQLEILIVNRSGLLHRKILRWETMLHLRSLHILLPRRNHVRLIALMRNRLGRHLSVRHVLRLITLLHVIRLRLMSLHLGWNLVTRRHLLILHHVWIGRIVRLILILKNLAE